MVTSARIALLVLCASLINATSVNSGELLTMRVSIFGPRSLSVRLSVETDADNRALAVTAEGFGFYHSSQIQLNGSRAPRTTVFELRGLPAGLNSVYQVKGILVGSNGPRATVFQLVRVLPEPIKRRRNTR